MDLGARGQQWLPPGALGLMRWIFASLVFNRTQSGSGPPKHGQAGGSWP